MRKLKMLGAFACAILLTGCQQLKPVNLLPDKTSSPGTSVPETLETVSAKTTDSVTPADIKTTAPDKNPSSSKPESVPAETSITQSSEAASPDIEELPDGTIRTSISDYREIAQLVLESVYGEEQEFASELPSYLAKGIVDNTLWFAVRFTLKNEDGEITREALIREDKPEQYSIVTINSRVPVDNLLDDDNASISETSRYLCYLTPFQNTGLFESSYNFKQGALPPADVLVHAAQKLIGEQPMYSETAILAALEPYFEVSEEYLRTASCYRPESEGYRYSEYSRTYRYALKSATTYGGLHTLTLYASLKSDNKFNKEITLVVEGTPEAFKLVSCKEASRSIPSYELPVTMASGNLKSSGENLTVELTLSNGFYYETASREGSFKSGFRGNYDLVLKSGEDEIFRTPAEIDGFGILNFPDKFKLSVSDLDGDGNYEFPICIWDKNGMAIQLYRIENNEIKKLTYPDGSLKIRTDSFSPALHSSGTGFFAECYNKETDSFSQQEFVLATDCVALQLPKEKTE